MRLAKLEQWLKQYEVEVSEGSKHFKATKAGYRVYPIPAHNGRKTEIPDKYLKALCKHFGLDVNDLLGS